MRSFFTPSRTRAPSARTANPPSSDFRPLIAYFPSPVASASFGAAFVRFGSRFGADLVSIGPPFGVDLVSVLRNEPNKDGRCILANAAPSHFGKTSRSPFAQFFPTFGDLDVKVGRLV